MTIVNYKKNFIFIHPRRTAGSSLVLSLLKYCSSDDIVCDDVLNDHSDKWLTMNLKEKFKPIIEKKLNIVGFKNLLASIIKILPLVKYIKKFNYSPDFNLNIPLFIKEPKTYSHATVNEIKKLVTKSFFDNAFIFTIVRNPYDQFLSFYQASGSKKNFKKFTETQASFFFNREISHFYENISIYGKILRFENFDEDIKELSNLLKLPENIFYIFEKTKVNEFKSKKGKKLDLSIIDDSSKEIIYSNARKIFEDFKYSKNINYKQ
jgi:hypothetical protein